MFVLVGLYRRDQRAQRKGTAARARVRGWVRRFLRRPAVHRKVEVSGGGTVMAAGEARLSVRPGSPPAPDAPVEERLEWVERAVDTAFRELDADARHRDQDVRHLVERVAELRSGLESDVGSLRQRLDEARVPERWEWLGAGAVLVGLGFAVIDAVVRSG